MWVAVHTTVDGGGRTLLLLPCSNSANSNPLATEVWYLFTTDFTIYRKLFKEVLYCNSKNYSKWSEESRSQAAWFNRSSVWKPLHVIVGLLFLLCFNISDFLVVKCSGVVSSVTVYKISVLPVSEVCYT